MSAALGVPGVIIPGAASGGVTASGVPAAGQVAYWTAASILAGSVDLQYVDAPNPQLSVGGTVGIGIVRLGNEAAIPGVLAADQRLIDFGLGPTADYPALTSVLMRGQGSAALTATQMLFGVGPAGRTFWNFPGNHRWHFGTATIAYDWGSGSTTWTSANGNLFFSYVDGSIASTRTPGLDRSWRLDSNFTGTAPIATTAFAINGSVVSGRDEWTISATGTSTYLRLTAFSGEVIIEPAGNGVPERGAIFRMVTNPAQTTGTFACYLFQGDVTNNRFISVASGTTTKYAHSIDGDIFISGGTGTFFASHINIDEDTPTIATATVGLARWQWGSVTVFQVDRFGGVTSDGALVLSGDITPAALGATENNYAPASFAQAAVLRLTAAGGGSTITGLAGGADGRLVTLANVGADTITLSDENAGSLAANRFALRVNIALLTDMVVELQYDGTSARWRAVGNW